LSFQGTREFIEFLFVPEEKDGGPGGTGIAHLTNGQFALLVVLPERLPQFGRSQGFHVVQGPGRLL
jgi:hypothetical protein